MYRSIADDQGRKAERDPRAATGRGLRLRMLGVIVGIAAAFAVVSARLVVLAVRDSGDLVIAKADPVATSFARPDMVDRNGRLVATDVALRSLYADPSVVLSRDELVEKVSSVIPDIDGGGLRRALAEPDRRFVWVKRGLTPSVAQRVHDLGVPGLDFKKELRRAYPLGLLAGHVVGGVNADNRGTAGLERFIDRAVGVEGVHGATYTSSAPVTLALDIGVEHTVEDELALAMRSYGAKAAAGIVMDIDSGEVLAAASLPGADPGSPADDSDQERLDRVAGGTYELGSVMKLVTLGMVLEGGTRALDSIVDVREPLMAGSRRIEDEHAAGRPLTVAEVFTHSSNVGAAMLALEAGPERQKAFLESVGLWSPIATEQGPVKAPSVPDRLGRAEEITLAYGHGIAVAPLQFAAAAASLLNGGTRVTPTYLKQAPGTARAGPRVVSEETSRALAQLMRLNVETGTGKRADVPGYEVGGKTGTAEIAIDGRYAEKSVISSFVAAFPMSAPRYLVMVSLFEPKGTAETRGEVLASTNAAPTAGRVIARIAPQLGVMPKASAVAGLE